MGWVPCVNSLTTGVSVYDIITLCRLQCLRVSLFPFPHNDESLGVAGCQHALIVVEADIQHGGRVALQLVQAGFVFTLHVQEVHTHVLTARHCAYTTRAKLAEYSYFIYIWYWLSFNFQHGKMFWLMKHRQQYLKVVLFYNVKLQNGTRCQCPYT